MNSQDFAKDLHSQKCKQIASGFLERESVSTDFQKANVEQALDYSLNQRAIHSKIITERVAEESTSDFSKAIQLSEEVFEKAVTEEGLEVYDLPTLNKFKSDLVKAVSMGRVSIDDIEKAKKDLGKLVKTEVTDKNGQKRTVWIKRGGEDEASGGKSKKVAYESDTKTKEEGDHIISRAKAALDNPKTPMSMRAKAQEMIDHETKKWSKEREAASDYSHKDHPHNEAHKAGIKAAQEGKATHSFDKTTEEGKAKADAWEAGHKSVSAVKKEKPEYDKELEDVYSGKKEEAKEKQPSAKEESKEHSGTYKKLKEDAKDGKLDMSKKELGKNIKADHDKEAKKDEPIGKTKSGKDIYDKHIGAGHDKYRDFTSEDHADAAKKFEWGSDIADDHANAAIRNHPKWDVDSEEHNTSSSVSNKKPKSTQEALDNKREEIKKNNPKSLEEHLSDKKGWTQHPEYDMPHKYIGKGIYAFKTEDDKAEPVYMSNPGKANEKEHDEDEAKDAYESEVAKAKEIVSKYNKDGSEKTSKNQDSSILSHLESNAFKDDKYMLSVAKDKLSKFGSSVGNKVYLKNHPDRIGVIVDAKPASNYNTQAKYTVEMYDKEGKSLGTKSGSWSDFDDKPKTSNEDSDRRKKLKLTSNGSQQGDFQKRYPHTS